MEENTATKIKAAAMIKLLKFGKAMQMNKGTKLLTIPTPIVARTETAPPFTA